MPATRRYDVPGFRAGTPITAGGTYNQGAGGFWDPSSAGGGYQIDGQPWAPPQVTVGPPGQQGPNQGMGDWGSDPFGYTNGSLLQPWTQPFQAPGGSGGGYAAPNLTPWSYQDFAYNFKAPGGYSSTDITAPGKFTYFDRAASTPFRAPTEADMRADPGYQSRIGSMTDAVTRAGAAAGTLRGGGTLKALSKYGQQIGSEEYDKTYGRRASEYDRTEAAARDLYGTNRANAAENYDRNFNTQFQVASTNEANRRQAYQASSDVALRGGELGYNIATGTYDRNQANAKAAWESQQEMARASAAAANATSDRDYNRAMNEYQMAHDLFRENQDVQWGRLSGMTNLGYGAASQQADYTGQYGGNLSDLYTGGANARAAGTVGGANAWNQAIGGGANTLMDLYAMNRFAPQAPPVGRAPGAAGIPPVPRLPPRRR